MALSRPPNAPRSGIRLGDVSATIGTRLVVTGLGLASAVLSARLLGPEGRGSYFVALSVMALTTQLATLGLHSSNTWLAARGRPLDALLANSFWLSVGGGGGTALLVGVTALVFGGVPGVDAAQLLVALIGVVPTHFYLLASSLLVGVGRIGTYNRFELAARCTPLLLMLLAALQPTATTFLMATVVGSYTVAGTLYRRVLPGWPGRFREALFTEGISYGIRAHAAAILSLAVVRVQPFILARVGGVKEVGFFSVASQIAEAITLLPATFGLVLFPVLTRHPARSREETARALGLTAAAMAVVCALVAVFAEPLLPQVFGPAFSPAGGVLLYWLPGIFCLSLVTVLSQYLASMGLPWSLVAWWGAALVLAASLAAVLAPERGAEGTAIALSVAYAGLLCGLTLVALRSRQRSP